MKTAEPYAHTRIVLPCLFLTIFSLPTFAETNLNIAIQNARTACSGIDQSMHDMKVKAGINTAVTSVGTVAGGVALGTGIAKYSVDKEQSELANKVAKLIAEKSNIPIEKLEIADEAEFRDAIKRAVHSDASIASDIQKINELEQKSKTLGNVRTGTLAASTATNIAGTAIAATNKVDEGLEEKINKCIASIKELSNVKLAARIEKTADDNEIAIADKIINACRDYEYIDITPINKRALGAAVSSGIGIGTGVVGTITSAVSNTDNNRHNDKGYALNTTANVMAGASTAASATATIFNATQISAIKRVAYVAEVCEGALK